MIRYSLRCREAHEFEAWFRSGADYEAQARRGLLTCPECGDDRIGLALMAPALVRGRGDRVPPAPAAPEAAPAAAPARVGGAGAPGRAVAGGRAMPDAMRAMLSRMRTEIERSCDDVGDGFAVEALAMHRGQSERRGIYGRTTDADRAMLEEEGVEVARIPWLPRSDG